MSSPGEGSNADIAKDMDAIWSKMFDVMHLSCQYSSSKGEYGHIGPNIVNPKCSELVTGVFNDATSSISFNLKKVRNSLQLLQKRREFYLKSSISRLESILLYKAKTLSECQTHLITRKERLRTQNITSEDRLRDLILEVYGEYGKSAIRCIRRGDYVENMNLLNMIWLVYKLRWERFMLRLYKDASEDGDRHRGTVQHTIMCAKNHNSDEFNHLCMKSKKIAAGLINGEGASKGAAAVSPESIQVLSIIRIFKGSSSNTDNFPRQPKLFENRISLGSLIEHIRQIMPTININKARTGSAISNGANEDSSKSLPGGRRPRERSNPDKDASGADQVGDSSSSSITPKSRLGRLSRYLKSMSIDWMQPASLRHFYTMAKPDQQDGLGNKSAPNSSRKAENEIGMPEKTNSGGNNTISVTGTGLISNLINGLVGGGSSNSSNSSKVISSSKIVATNTSKEINSSKPISQPLENVEPGNILPIYSSNKGVRNVVSMPHLESLEKLMKKQFASSNIAWDRVYFCIEERFFALRCNSLSSTKAPNNNLSEEDYEGYVMMAFLEVIQAEILAKAPSNNESAFYRSQLSTVRDTLNKLSKLDDKSKFEILPFKRLNIVKSTILAHLPTCMSPETLDVSANKILLLLKACPDIIRINIGGNILHFSVAAVSQLAELRNSYIGVGDDISSIHGLARPQFVNQCPHPWLPLLSTQETFLLDSLYVVSTIAPSSSLSSSSSSSPLSSSSSTSTGGQEGLSYMLVPLHDICIHELAKQALSFDVTSNARTTSANNSSSTCNLQHLNNFTLLTPDSARSILTTGSSNGGADGDATLMALSEKGLSASNIDKFLHADFFHNYILFSDDFIPPKKSSDSGNLAKSATQKCMYLAQIYISRDPPSQNEAVVNVLDHGSLIDNEILRTAIILRNYQSVASGTGKSLASSDSVRKLANISEIEQKEQLYSKNDNGNTVSSNTASKEKDWDRSVLSTICRWRSCICEAISSSSHAVGAGKGGGSGASGHQLPQLCFFHFQLKNFMDSNAERMYGDSNNFLPKKAPNIPKHITVDALAKFEIITKNLGSEGSLNIITNSSNVGSAISDSIAPSLDNNYNPDENQDSQGGGDSRASELSSAAGNVRRGGGKATGASAPLSLSKHNLSKTLSERSRDMYLIRAASSLLQELWDGKLKGTLQIFMKKVVSEFVMKSRLEAKLNSYKNSMTYFINRVNKLTHPYEAKLLLMAQSSPGKSKLGSNSQRGVAGGASTKVSPRAKKTVLFQNASSTNVSSNTTHVGSSSKIRTTLPAAPIWSVWKAPKRAASVIELQLELERGYLDLLRKEGEVANELRHFIGYKMYPTTEVNVIRKEQKLLKETINFKIENQEILPLSHIAQHYQAGRDTGDKANDITDTSTRDDDNQNGSPGKDPIQISSALLANLAFYQSLKQLAIVEAAFVDRKLSILSQKRMECDEMQERSAIQQQKMLQALNKDKMKDPRAKGVSKQDKSGNRPDPAAFSSQSRF